MGYYFIPMELRFTEILKESKFMRYIPLLEIKVKEVYMRLLKLINGLEIKRGGVVYLWQLWLPDNLMILMTNLLIGFAILCDKASMSILLKISLPILSRLPERIEISTASASDGRLLPIRYHELGIMNSELWA